MTIRNFFSGAGFALVAAGLCIVHQGARPQNRQAPAATVEPGPSPRGPQDEAGQTNTQTPAKVLEATRLIRTGRKYLLGHVYEPSMPLLPGNTWRVEMKPPLAVGRQTANVEFFQGEIAQNGTQLDGLGHFGIRAEGESDARHALYYNRLTGDQVRGPGGLQRLGVEKLKPFFTVGILVDVKRYANRNVVLEPGTEITRQMVLDTLAAQGMTEGDIREGDVVLFVTGWEENWGKDTQAYYAGVFGNPGATPGLGVEVARWLASRKVACVGADNWGIEVVPNPQAPPEIPFPVHHELLVKNGIPQQESMSLVELAADLAAEWMPAKQKGRASGTRIYRFAYIFVPVPIQGASGSPGIPMAVR